MENFKKKKPLNSLISGMRKAMFMAMCLLFATVQISAAQNITITGTVVDESGDPMPGVNIVVKGTLRGVVTEINGKYSIDVPGRDAVLVFSFIGHDPQEILIENQTRIDLTLREQSQELDEVVIIGYGTVKKKDLTGAVSSVTAKELQADVAKSAANALQGKVAGVSVTSNSGQPGAGMNISIRGISSIKGSGAPLYVIDGVYGDINMIDPADIASMEVLKDASAAAIYGSRAANGVVLITTKSGRKEAPLRVSINAFTGFQKNMRKLDVLNGEQWIKLLNDNKVDIPVASYSGAGTDWHDEVFRTAPINKANINIDGGSKTATYSLSAGYLNQKGILPNSGYQSFNIRAKNDFSFFNNRLRVGESIIFKNSVKNKNVSTVTDILRMPATVPVYDDNRIGGYGGVEQWMKNLSNPVGDMMVNTDKDYLSQILLNAFAEVQIIKGLKYKLNVGYNKDDARNNYFIDIYDFGQSHNNVPDLSEKATYDNSWLVENTLNYDKTIGKHTIYGLLGYSAQKNQSRNFMARRDELSPGTSTINAGSVATQSTSGSATENSIVSMFGRLMYSYDSRYMLAFSVRRDGSSRFADGHRYGVFPSASVGWNIHNEGFFTSLKPVVNELKIRASYGKLGNQDIGDYVTQKIVTSGINYVQGSSWWEGAIPGTKWISPEDLTWEETSTINFGIDAGFFNDKFTLSADVFTQETKNVLMDINMPASTGKKGSPTMNAGTIRNIGLEIALNHRNTIGELYYNVGVNASFIKNEVTAITIGTAQEFGGYNPQGEGTITWAKVGDPIGAFYLIKTDGIFQDNGEVQAHVNENGNLIQPNAEPGDIRFIDHNGDGQITEADRQYAGSPFPKCSFGIRGGLGWKGFDLNLFFDGMVGNKIYNYTRTRMESMNELTNYSVTALDAWSIVNTNTDIPRFTISDKNNNARRVSDRWLEKGGYLRLKTIEFGYTLPEEWLAKVSIQRLRVYAVCENPFTITKYSGYTPDLGRDLDGDRGNMSTGTDHGRYPIPFIMSFGLQLDF